MHALCLPTIYKSYQVPHKNEPGNPHHIIQGQSQSSTIVADIGFIEAYDTDRTSISPRHEMVHEVHQFPSVVVEFFKNTNITAKLK